MLSKRVVLNAPAVAVSSGEVSSKFLAPSHPHFLAPFLSVFPQQMGSIIRLREHKRIRQGMHTLSYVNISAGIELARKGLLRLVKKG